MTIKKSSLKDLALNRFVFKTSIIMLIFLVIVEILKMNLDHGNFEKIIQIMVIYYIFMSVIYVFGFFVIIIYALYAKDIINIHKGYFIYAIVSTALLAFIWIPCYNVLTILLEIVNVSNNTDISNFYSFGMSLTKVISDLNQINAAMILFVINGAIHWGIGYYASPQKVTNEKSKYTKNILYEISNKTLKNINSKPIQVNVIDFYKKINQKGIKNRIDSLYWIYYIESVIKREDDVNKRFLIIRVFNRLMNENSNLMRVYFKINNEEIYEDYFVPVKQYNNDNIIEFVIQRDLAEEKVEVEIIAYIINGSKKIPTGNFVYNIQIDEDMQLLASLKEKYFINNNDICKNIPSVENDYWLCTCGYINDIHEEECCHCKIHKSKIIEMLSFDKLSLLEGIESRIKMKANKTIDDIINDISNTYFEKFDIDRDVTRKSIDRNLLIQRQNEFISEYIDDLLLNNPIKFDKNISLEEIINDYCTINSTQIITKEMILNRIDYEKYQVLYKLFLKEEKEKTIKNRKKLFGGIAIMVSFVTISLIYEVLNQDKTLPTNESSYSNDVNEYYDENYNDSSENNENNIQNNNQDIFSNDYVFYDSNSRYLEEWELENLTKYELKIARNEIYARYGYDFKDEKLSDYFYSKQWYVNKIQADGTIDPEEWTDDNLNEYEKSNINLIRKYEQL